MMKHASIGDRVRYKAAFLRSIGAYTGDMGHARGVVKGTILLGAHTTLAVIGWDLDVPDRVNVANLERDPTRKAVAS